MGTPILDPTMLRPEEKAAWRRYLEKHGNGLRAEALASLQTLLDQLEDGERRRSFAEAVLDAWVDPVMPAHGMPPELRHPLTKDLLLPVLVERVEKDSGRHARLLAVLLLHSRLAPRDVEVLGDWTPRVLLERALAHDDPAAAEWLVSLIFRDLDYDLHELPSGVLSDADVFAADVERLATLTEDLGRTHEFAEALKFLREQAKTWREFQALEAPRPTYEAFMRDRSVSDLPDPF